MRLGIRAREAIAVTLLTFLVAVTASLVHLAQLSRVVVEEDARQADLIARQISAQANRALAAAPAREPWRALRESAELRGLIDASLGVSPHLVDVMIVDEWGRVVIHGERQKEGTPAPVRLALAQLFHLDVVRRLHTLMRGVPSTASLPHPGRAAVRQHPPGPLVHAHPARTGRGFAPEPVILGLAMALAWLVAMALANVVRQPLRALVVTWPPAAR
jgi:hypothetical protein